MLRDITLGQFYPVDSPLHRLDPRTKIIGTLALIAALFVVDSPVGFAVYTLFLAALIALSRVPPRYMLRGLRLILFILIFACALSVFTTPGRVVAEIWRWQITAEGIRQALLMIFRLVYLIIGSSLLTLCTRPVDLTDGIERLLAPLARLGWPTHEFAMMMGLTLRFIPILQQEADRTVKAQLARGADLESGGLVHRARNLLPVLVPLFISAFSTARELAVAMEARCYQGGKGRTHLRVPHFAPRDALAAASILLLIAGLSVIRWG